MANAMLMVEDIVHVVVESDTVNVLYMKNRDVVRFNTKKGTILSVVKLPSAEDYEAARVKGAEKHTVSQQNFRI